MTYTPLYVNGYLNHNIIINRNSLRHVVKQNGVNYKNWDLSTRMTTIFYNYRNYLRVNKLLLIQKKVNRMTVFILNKTPEVYRYLIKAENPLSDSRFRSIGIKLSYIFTMNLDPLPMNNYKFRFILNNSKYIHSDYNTLLGGASGGGHLFNNYASSGYATALNSKTQNIFNKLKEEWEAEQNSTNSDTTADTTADTTDDTTADTTADTTSATTADTTADTTSATTAGTTPEEEKGIDIFNIVIGVLIVLLIGLGIFYFVKKRNGNRNSDKEMYEEKYEEDIYNDELYE